MCLGGVARVTTKPKIEYVLITGCDALLIVKSGVD